MYLVPSGDAFAKNITHYRKKRGLTRLKLAALLEIPVTDLIDLETGLCRDVEFSLVDKLCLALHTDKKTLLGE